MPILTVDYAKTTQQNFKINSDWFLGNQNPLDQVVSLKVHTTFIFLGGDDIYLLKNILFFGKTIVFTCWMKESGIATTKYVISIGIIKLFSSLFAISEIMFLKLWWTISRKGAKYRGVTRTSGVDRGGIRGINPPPWVLNYKELKFFFCI